MRELFGRKIRFACVVFLVERYDAFVVDDDVALAVSRCQFGKARRATRGRGRERQLWHAPSMAMPVAAQIDFGGELGAFRLEFLVGAVFEMVVEEQRAILLSKQPRFKIVA